MRQRTIPLDVLQRIGQHQRRLVPLIDQLTAGTGNARSNGGSPRPICAARAS